MNRFFLRVIVSVGLYVVMFPNHARAYGANGDIWYVISQVTFRCVRSPDDPELILKSLHEKGYLTQVYEVPFVMGHVIRIRVVPEIGHSYDITLIQPIGACEVIRNMEEENGQIPDPNHLN